MDILDIQFDLRVRELSIWFGSQSQAKAYQAKNPKARIKWEEDGRQVWLPVTSHMASLRSSSQGMIIIFDSVEAARAWVGRSVIGEEFIYGTPVVAAAYIKRTWDRSALWARLSDDMPVRQVPLPTSQPAGYPPSPYPAPRPLPGSKKRDFTQDLIRVLI